LTLIFPLTTNKLTLRKRAGFTLVEILIVLVIFAGLAAMGIPALFRKGDNIKKVARQLTALTKEVRNRAKLKNATYRIVIDMSEEPHKYWVEYTQGSRPIPANLYDQKKDDDTENPNKITFKRDDLISKKDKELPSGLYFAEVETVNTKAPITQGQAYIHYFPEGFVEASVIQVTDRKNLTWTFVISPLTGQADIIQEARSLKDMDQ
jgi:general secretion pathway protein H